MNTIARKKTEVLSTDDYMLDIDLSKNYLEQIDIGIYDCAEVYFSNDSTYPEITKWEDIPEIMKKNHLTKHQKIEYGFRFNTKSAEFTYARDSTWIAMNVIYRYLTNNPIGVNEIFVAKRRKKEYFSGERDMKFAVYGLVHAYLINNILSPECWYVFFPKDDIAIMKWNEYLKQIHDVPSSVLKLFEIDTFTKRAPVFNYIFAWADFYEITVPNRGNMNVEAGYVGGWPSRWPKKLDDKSSHH